MRPGTLKLRRLRRSDLYLLLIPPLICAYTAVAVGSFFVHPLLGIMVSYLCLLAALRDCQAIRLAHKARSQIPPAATDSASPDDPAEETRRQASDRAWLGLKDR